MSFRDAPPSTSICRSSLAIADSSCCHSVGVSSGLPASSQRTYARMSTRSCGMRTSETWSTFFFLRSGEGGGGAGVVSAGAGAASRATASTAGISTTLFFTASVTATGSSFGYCGSSSPSTGIWLYRRRISLSETPSSTSICRSSLARANSVACHSGVVSSGLPASSQRTYARMPTRSSGTTTSATSRAASGLASPAKGQRGGCGGQARKYHDIGWGGAAALFFSRAWIVNSRNARRWGTHFRSSRRW